jgi:hypothetical protein
VGRCVAGKASRDRPQCRSGALEEEGETNLELLAKPFCRVRCEEIQYGRLTASLYAVTRSETPIPLGTIATTLKHGFESRWGTTVARVSSAARQKALDTQLPDETIFTSASIYHWLHLDLPNRHPPGDLSGLLHWPAK